MVLILDKNHQNHQNHQKEMDRKEKNQQNHVQPLPVGKGVDSPSPQKVDETPSAKGGGGTAYAERKEQQKRLRKAERAVEESEKKIAQMEQRLRELDQLLCDPKNASDMMLVAEYTDTKRRMDEEVERWEKVSQELENINIILWN